MDYKYEYPSEENLKKIYADVNASKESMETDVNYLMQWMKQQSHLPNITDKEFLSGFLLGSKNSLEKTKQRLNSYYCLKSKMPEIYNNRDPSSLGFRKSMKTLFHISLPKLTPDNYRIHIFGYGDHNDEDIPTTHDVVKLYSSFMDLDNKTDHVPGHITIYDFANISSALYKVLMGALVLLADVVKNGPPARMRTIYAVNLTPTLQFLMNFGLNFLGEKISKRVVIWKKDRRDMVEIFPKEILPVEYGGTELSIDELKENSLRRLIHHRDWLLSLDSDKADLSKIPNLSTAYDSGLEGSFRKLSFD